MTTLPLHTPKRAQIGTIICDNFKTVWDWI